MYIEKLIFLPNIILGIPILHTPNQAPHPKNKQGVHGIPYYDYTMIY